MVQEEAWKVGNERIRREAEKFRASAWPSLLVTGSDRPKALKAIYKQVAGHESPHGNIASAAISARYPADHPGQVRVLLSQVLCMISKYHVACMVNGSSTTSPIPSQEIEEKLPPLENYTPPRGTGITDIRIRENKARCMRVAVWLHHLDMTLSGGEVASRSLVQSEHIRGCLLSYFLAPLTSNLCFEEVVT